MSDLSGASERKHCFGGACHCENIRYEFHTDLQADAFTPRTCQCALCRAHGASWITDPYGVLNIQIADRSKVNFYRFALKTSDFLVCRECGVLPIALCEVGGAVRGALNVGALPNGPFTAPAVPMSFGHETPDERVARRARNWIATVNLTDDG